MRTPRFATVTLLSLLVGVVSACGDDSERLSADELAEQGNAICTEVDAEFEAAFSEFPDDAEPTPEQIQEFASVAAEIVDRAIGRFEDLEPPEDLQEGWDDTLEKARAAQDVIEEAAEDPEAAATLFNSEEDPFEEVNAGLEEVGITACSDDE